MLGTISVGIRVNGGRGNRVRTWPEIGDGKSAFWFVATFAMGRKWLPSPGGQVSWVLCAMLHCSLPRSVGQTAEAEGKEGQIGLEKHHQCSCRKINSKLEFYLVLAISCMILFSHLSFQRPSVLHLFVPPLLQLFPLLFSHQASVQAFHLMTFPCLAPLSVLHW